MPGKRTRTDVPEEIARSLGASAEEVRLDRIEDVGEFLEKMKHRLADHRATNRLNALATWPRWSACSTRARATLTPAEPLSGEESRRRTEVLLSSYEGKRSG